MTRRQLIAFTIWASLVAAGFAWIETSRAAAPRAIAAATVLQIASDAVKPRGAAAPMAASTTAMQPAH